MFLYSSLLRLIRATFSRWLVCMSVCVCARMWFWIKTLQMFPDKYWVLWLVFETTHQMSRFQPLSRAHYWELIVASECSKVFLASKWMVCFHLFICLLPPLLFFSSFFLSFGHVLKFPKMLSHISYFFIFFVWVMVLSGEDSITQYPASIRISHPSYLISCFLPSHMCVLDTTLRRCLRHAGTWLPSLSVWVSHLLLLKHAYSHSFQVLQRDIYRVLQHICRIEMPTAALFLFLFWCS